MLAEDKKEIIDSLQLSCEWVESSVCMLCVTSYSKHFKKLTYTV